ncbi:MAG: hypothetical protein WCO29_21900 [Nostocales cyanobacterium ELA583]
MITVWELRGAIAVWEGERVRSLFGELRGCDRCLGSWRGAITVWELRGAIAVWEVEGMRSLFGELRGCDHCLGSLKGAIAIWGVEGCDHCLGVEGCDSEALLQAVRCLGI